MYKNLQATRVLFTRNSILQNSSSSWPFLIKKIHLNECYGGYFYGTQVPETQVTQKTRFSQTQVLKKWYIPKYFQNSGSLQKHLANSGIWPFWPQS